MTAPIPEEPPEYQVSRLTKDPVRIVWVVYSFVQAVLIVLIAAEIVTAKVSAVVTGVALAVYVAVSELYVHKETIPVYKISEPELNRLRESSAAANGKDV